MAKKDAATFASPARDQTAASLDLALEQSTGNTARKDDVQAGGLTSGFYIYIGPSIKGLIRSGTIYRGDRAHALEEAKAAIEAQPLVKTLIIAGDSLPKARLKVKTPGNALYANYQKIIGK